MRGVLGIAAALALGSAAGPVVTTSPARAAPSKRAPISGLKWAEQLGPGGYHPADLVRAGFGGDCRRPPVGTSKGDLVQRHRLKMAEKKVIRRERANA